MQKQRVLQRDLGDGNYSNSSAWVEMTDRSPEFYWRALGNINSYPSASYTPLCSVPFVGLEFTSSERPKGRYMSDMFHTRSYYRDWHTSDIQTWNHPTYYCYRSRRRVTNWWESYRYSDMAGIPTEYDGYIAVPSDFSARAWATLQPRFEGEISMLNFLYELKDLKPLIKYVSKFNFSRLTRDMRKVLQSVRTDPSKPIAEAHLVNEFAIKPMLSDIGAILAQIYTKVADAQKNFGDVGSTFQKSHYSESQVLQSDSEYNAGKYDMWSTHMWRVPRRRTLRYTATLRYKYKYTQRPAWEAFTRYWGLDLNAEALWNAIPFSFLIDYFIKIGDSLHAAARDPNVSLTEYEYSESSLIQSYSGILVRPAVKVPYIFVNNKRFDSGEVLLSGYTGEKFRRVVTEPNKGIALPRLANKLSVGQLQNMAALTRCFL